MGGKIQRRFRKKQIEQKMKKETDLHYGKKILQPLILPKYTTLQEEAKYNLEKASFFIINGKSSCVIDWLDMNPYLEKNVLVLKHKLSEYYKKLSDSHSPEIKSIREILFLTNNNDKICFKTKRSFFESMLYIYHNITGNNDGFRTVPVRSKLDNYENCVIYPNHTLIKQSISDLYDFLSIYKKDNPLFSAMVSMISIFTTHPFTDGNGRVGRILFNSIIFSEFNTEYYLPLYELSELSEGGFRIRHRIAQYKNNWLPLSEFISNAYSLLYTNFGKNDVSDI